MPDLSSPYPTTPRQNHVGNRTIGATRLTAILLIATAALLILGIAFVPGGPAVADASKSDPAGYGQMVQSGQGDPVRGAVNEALDLLDSEIIALDLPVDPGHGFTLVTAVGRVNDGHPITLDLWPHSNRASGFQVRVQTDDGALVAVESGPERTLRGTIVEVPGSQVAASLLDDGLHALILLPGETDLLWIEPVEMHVPGEFDPALHVVYASTDIACGHGVCGVTGQIIHPPRLRSQEQQQQQQGWGGVAGLTCETVNLAIDVDFAFVQIWGNQTNALNRVNNTINNTNLIYESQVGIVHLISEIIVRTAATNPYTCTSGSGSAQNLLNSFANVWSSFPESQIPRNVAHLFTGCTGINASGIAQLGGANVQGNTNFGVCRPNHYALTVHQSSLACTTHVAAHELGHNWSAQHCDGTFGCSGTIMQSFFTPGACSTNFSNFSQNQILNHKNHVFFGACTVLCQPDGPPANNTCQSSTIIDVGSTPFSNLGATTTGPNEPNLCNFSGDSNVQADVWFRHTATCSGDLTISLCDSSPGFDTKLAVYGIACPTDPGTALACNKDFCGQLSQVTISAIEGQTYRIRVGGHNGGQGIGTVTVTCDPVVPANNTCQDSQVVPVGSTPFSTFNATTDGPDEPDLCTFDGDSNVQSDVWFRHTATCSGNLLVSTCDSSPGFDTKVAVYGIACPTEPGTALGCNTDSCGELSEVSVPVVQGQTYRIRVGGHDGAQGQGVLTIACDEDDPGTCPADLTGNGNVGVPDLLELLANWGSCPAPCPADLTGNGSVGVPDLLELLAAWGPCP